MIIYNANCFVGRPPCKLVSSFLSPENILTEMDDLGIEKTWVTDFNSVYGSNPQKSNRELSKKLKKYSGRLEACWFMHPSFFECHNNKNAFHEELKSEGVRMVRIVGKDFIMHPASFRKLANNLLEAGSILYMDVLGNFDSSYALIENSIWGKIVDTIKSFPELNIILFSQKLASDKARVQEILAEYPNAYLDLSGLQCWQIIEEINNKMGCSKIVFGGNMPCFDAGQFLVELVYSNISDEDKEKIAYKNLENIIKEKLK